MSYRMKIYRWWHSRTMWLNIANIAALAPLAGVAVGYIDQIGLSELAAAKLGMALSLFVAMSNLYLRKTTTAAFGDEVSK